jgi:hypothetical protein
LLINEKQLNCFYIIVKLYLEKVFSIIYMTTYTEVNNAIQIIEGDINNTWYYGSLDTNVFTNTNTITNFTNNGIILGGGGSNMGKNGKDGLYNIGSITNLVNNGAFLGGGGAGDGDVGGSGGAGGGGGGGDFFEQNGGNGGSLINANANGFNSGDRGGGGGGGPFGDGGFSVGWSTEGDGGRGYNNISRGTGASTEPITSFVAGGGGGYGGNSGYLGGGGGGGGGLKGGGGGVNGDSFGGDGGYSINNSGTINHTRSAGSSFCQIHHDEFIKNHTHY